MQYKEINSKENNLYKFFKGLKTKKGRQKSGYYLIEGERLVEEAIQSNCIVEYVLISSVYESKQKFILSPDSKIIKFPEKLFNQLAETTNPQGIIAVVRKEEASIETIQGDHNPILVILDGIQDPGNLGTIIRTSAAAGVSAVILTEGTVDVYNPKVIRSTMGALFHIPIIANVEDSIILDWLRKQKIKIVVADVNATKYYFSIDMSASVAIVIGNENKGPSDLWKGQAQYVTKIPLLGKTESLNASMAAGILIYEAVRQRLK